jgi:AcrR family transcriptional regulator
VSIGSLYQYFPGKTALMAAVIEREADADLDAMRTVRMIASKGRGLLCDLLVERRSELAPGIDPSAVPSKRRHTTRCSSEPTR